jgi:hypothetical protein
MVYLSFQWLLKLFVVFTMSATSIQASYYMDETDSNISYLGAQWNTDHGTNPVLEFVDKTKLYGGN